MRTYHNEQTPLISVLMGIYYQRPDTRPLDRSIRSILSQSIRDFELLICADGSTDEAIRLIKQLGAEDRRIRLLPLEKRYTLPSKLNACFRASRGALLARMDDDDFSHPNRLEKQVAFLKQQPKIGFVGCNAGLWLDGELVGIRQLPQYPEVRSFLFVQPFIHPSLMFRREVLISANGYSEEKICLKCEDYDLLLRLYELGFRGANLQECLLDYTMSLDGNRNLRDRWNEMLIRYHHFKKLGLLPGVLPYVIKPVVVGILPTPVLGVLKKRFIISGGVRQ